MRIFLAWIHNKKHHNIEEGKNELEEYGIELHKLALSKKFESHSHEPRSIWLEMLSHRVAPPHFDSPILRLFQNADLSTKRNMN